MATRFDGDVAFDDIVRAAGVEMDPKGLYFAKHCRNCESQAAFNAAVRMALSSKDREIMRLTQENAKLADRHSREAAKTAALAEENCKIVKTAIARGLESLPDMAPATRERLLCVNGG